VVTDGVILFFWLALNEVNIRTIWNQYLKFASAYLFFVFYPTTAPQSCLNDWILFPYDFLSYLNYYNYGCTDPETFARLCKQKMEEFIRNQVISEEHRQKWLEFFKLRMLSNTITFDKTAASFLLRSDVKEENANADAQNVKPLSLSEFEQLSGLGFLKLPWPTETEINGMVQLRLMTTKHEKQDEDQNKSLRLEDEVQTIKLSTHVKIEQMNYLQTDRWYKLLTKNNRYLFAFNTVPEDL
jgi:hypothetical protein